MTRPHPSIAVLDGSFKRRRHPRSEPQGRVRLLHRLRLLRHPIEPDQLPRVVRLAGRPQRLHRLQHLREPTHPPLPGDPEGRMHPVAQPHPGDHAAFAQLIHRRQRLRQLHRIPVRQHDDRDPQAHTFRQRRHIRQERQRLQALAPPDNLLLRPEAVVAERLRLLCHVPDKSRVEVPVGKHLGKTEAHRHPPAPARHDLLSPPHGSHSCSVRTVAAVYRRHCPPDRGLQPAPLTCPRSLYQS